jgi:hypothetical protein
MKTFIAAFALIAALPAAAQTAPAQDHSQHKGMDHSQHKGMDHGKEHKDCCKHKGDDGKPMECCAKAMKDGKKMACCDKHDMGGEKSHDANIDRKVTH